MMRLRTALRIVGLIVALALALLATVSCGDGNDTEPTAGKAGAMEVTNAYARGVMDSGAVYFTMKNTGDTDDTLIGVSTEAAGKAALHETVAGEEATMKMQPVAEIEILARREATLEPGGYHVMLMDLKAPLEEGDTIELVLTFQQAGAVIIQAPVISFAEPGDGMDVEMDNGMD